MVLIRNEKKERGLSFILMVIAIIAALSYLIGGMFGVFGGDDIISGPGNVAVIPIKGLIVSEDGQYFTATTSSVTTIERLKKAAESSGVKAIMLDINSGGGSPVASDEIAKEISKIDKPTIALIRDAGASGAFWIATSCDWVIANEMSLTASIGVISSYLEFSGMLDDYNVTYQRLVAGNLKDIGSPYKKMTYEEKELYDAKLMLIRKYFVEAVARYRNLPLATVDKLADGSFMLGVEAKDHGLIDQLGGQAEAVAWLEEQIGTEVSLAEYKERATLADLLSSTMHEGAFLIGQGIGTSLYQSSVQQSPQIR